MADWKHNGVIGGKDGDPSPFTMTPSQIPPSVSSFAFSRIASLIISPIHDLGTSIF
jgi:hypothetical protein